MQRQRVRLIVEVDLDPVPGGFDCAEDHKEALQQTVDRLYPWYHPTVTIQEVQS